MQRFSAAILLLSATVLGAVAAEQQSKEFCYDNGCQTVDIKGEIFTEVTYPDLKIVNYERYSEDQQVPNRFTAVVNCHSNYLITEGQHFTLDELNEPSRWVAERACDRDWASTRTE